MRKLEITFNYDMIPELYRIVQFWGRGKSNTFDFIRRGIEENFPEIAERYKMDAEDRMSLLQWSDHTSGARAAMLKAIDEYIDKRNKKTDRPYVQAELDFIMASKDNMWKWLSSGARSTPFHYRNHKYDKKGNIVSCEAYIP